VTNLPHHPLQAQVIQDVRAAALLERNAPNREEKMDAVRSEINDWVARYRRDTSFSGRPSYGNTYSAVNAVAGHLNSFGPTAPIPKKRLERLVKVRDGGLDWQSCWVSVPT
jgi:photosystem II Psb27 protein